MLRELPSPWSTTDSSALEADLAGTEPPWRRVIGAVRTLIEALLALPDHPERQLPPPLDQSYPFLYGALSEAMPTFGTVATERVVSVLRGDAETPPEDAAGVLQYVWLRYVVVQHLQATLKHLVGRSEDAALSPEQVAVLFRTLRTRLAEIEPGVGGRLVGLAARVGKTDALPHLRAIHEDAAFDDDVRDEARRYRAWVEQNFVDD